MQYGGNILHPMETLRMHVFISPDVIILMFSLLMDYLLLRTPIFGVHLFVVFN